MHQNQRKAFKQAAGLLAAMGIAMLLTAGAALAQEPAPTTTATGTISPAKEAAIRKLLDLTGAKKNEMAFADQLTAYLKSMLEKNLPATEHKAEISASLISKVSERMNSDEFIAQLVPVYDRAFTEEELGGIIEFYETPAGKKLLESSAALTLAANKISDNWIKTMIPEILDQLLDEYPELKQPAAPSAGGAHSMH